VAADGVGPHDLPEPVGSHAGAGVRLGTGREVMHDALVVQPRDKRDLRGLEVRPEGLDFVDHGSPPISRWAWMALSGQIMASGSLLQPG